MRQYTKYVGMGRMAMRDRTISRRCAHGGYCRSISFDCGEMGKGFRTLKLPEEKRLWKGRVGGIPGQRTNESFGEQRMR